MTRLTSDERRAIELELDALDREIVRLRSLLAAQPAGSDGDTIRLLQPLCPCGLPRDHRHPITGEPRPCADETARIALDDETRTRPPVPMTSKAAHALADLVDLDRELREGPVFVTSDGTGLRYCCAAGSLVYPNPCIAHGAQA
jgi:hypothetical protein